MYYILRTLIFLFSFLSTVCSVFNLILERKKVKRFTIQERAQGLHKIFYFIPYTKIRSSEEILSVSEESRGISIQIPMHKCTQTTTHAIFVPTRPVHTDAAPSRFVPPDSAFPFYVNDTMNRCPVSSYFSSTFSSNGLRTSTAIALPSELKMTAPARAVER